MNSPASQLLDRDDPYYLQLDRTATDLISSVKVVGAYDCPHHDRRNLCGCKKALKQLSIRDKQLFIKIHWNLEWEQHIIKTDAAFDYIIDDADQNAESERLNGTSPAGFARGFAEDIFTKPALVAPAASLAESTRALMVFWAKHAAGWRIKYTDGKQARAHMQSCQPGDAGDERYPDMSTPNLSYPPQPAKRLMLQRMRLMYALQPGHVSMVFLMALRPLEEEKARYQIIGVRPCHAGYCDAWQLKLTKDFLDGVMRWMHSGLKNEVLVDCETGERRGPPRFDNASWLWKIGYRLFPMHEGNGTDGV